MADHRSIVAFYEQCLADHGDSFRGVGWTKSQEETDRRYSVMLEIAEPVPSEGASLIDFGCGAAHLYEYMLRTGRGRDLEYIGVDASERFLAIAKSKFPQLHFLRGDGIDGLPVHADYVIMNGIFTVRADLTQEEMWDYVRRVLRGVYPSARRGIAFNVMSKHVDWERRDLFHLPTDVLTGFITRELSRHFIIRHDYGLYEYTTYVFRSARTGDESDAGT